MFEENNNANPKDNYHKIRPDGGDSRLRTREERVNLLKAGNTSKIVEKMYLKSNNLKILNAPLLFEPKKCS